MIAEESTLMVNMATSPENFLIS